MNPVAQAKPQLISAVETLLETLVDDDIDAAVFFAQLLTELRAAEDEPDLLEVFLSLSTTAFRGFSLNDDHVGQIDSILERSQQIAQTFGMGNEGMH